MNLAVTWAAQYLLFVMAAVVAGSLLTAPRRVWASSVAAGVLGLALVGLFIVVGAAVYSDPRPFVLNPALHPLFPHAADNGFPSDHSAAAGLLTVLAWRLRAAAGAVVGAGAVLVAAARVAAQVHHVQDVVAGLLLGVLAGVAAVAVVHMIQSRRRGAQQLTSKAS